jgi:hypothetical protein
MAEAAFHLWHGHSHWSAQLQFPTWFPSIPNGLLRLTGGYAAWLTWLAGQFQRPEDNPWADE